MDGRVYDDGDTVKTIQLSAEETVVGSVLLTGFG